MQLKKKKKKKNTWHIVSDALIGYVASDASVAVSSLRCSSRSRISRGYWWFSIASDSPQARVPLEAAALALRCSRPSDVRYDDVNREDTHYEHRHSDSTDSTHLKYRKNRFSY